MWWNFIGSTNNMTHKLTTDEKVLSYKLASYPDALDNFKCEACAVEVWKKLLDDDKRCGTCIDLKRVSGMIKNYDRASNTTYLFYYDENGNRKVQFQTKGDLTNKDIKINLENKDVKEVRKDCFYCGQGVYDDTFKVTEKGLEYPAHKECILTAEKPKSSLDIYIPSKREWGQMALIMGILATFVLLLTFPSWFIPVQDAMRKITYNALVNPLTFQVMASAVFAYTILWLTFSYIVAKRDTADPEFVFIMLGIMGYVISWLAIIVIFGVLGVLSAWNVV